MATVAENLLKVNEGVDKVEALNAELAQSLYGGDTGYRGYYDEFWDAIQENGNRRVYTYAFAWRGWNAKVFKPKYDIILGNGYEDADNAFGNMNSNSGFPPLDMVALCEEQGIVIDTSQVTRMSFTFRGDGFLRWGVIDMRNVTSVNGVFYGNGDYKLERIDKILCAETTPWASNCFQNQSKLEYIRFEGVIGQNNLNLQWSTKLSKASITSIINALSTTTNGLTVTLSKTAVESAFGSTTSIEWTNLIGTRSNWTISLV